LFGENTLKCSIHKHQKGDRIYIWGESMGVIRHNISKFMHKNMLYKINSALCVAAPPKERGCYAKADILK
jgi:hypothetical protein